jgi:hypothetical protein
MIEPWLFCHGSLFFGRLTDKRIFDRIKTDVRNKWEKNIVE